MRTHPHLHKHHARHTPIIWAAALMLASCGGDVSWCYHNKSGQVVAGYNTTQCLPDGAGKPDTATSQPPQASVTP